MINQLMFSNGLAGLLSAFVYYASLRQTGDEIVPYIDNSYLQRDIEGIACIMLHVLKPMLARSQRSFRN